MVLLQELNAQPEMRGSAAHGSAQNAVEGQSGAYLGPPVDLKHLKRRGVCDPQSRQAVTATPAGKLT
jgi:hypothetical protein